jgi:hypothetical protein
LRPDSTSEITFLFSHVFALSSFPRVNKKGNVSMGLKVTNERRDAFGL